MVILEITSEILKKSVPCNYDRRPAVIALREQVPNIERAVCDGYHLYGRDYDGNAFLYYMSDALIDQLDSFDKGGEFICGDYLIDDVSTPMDFMCVNAGKTTE